MVTARGTDGRDLHPLSDPIVVPLKPEPGRRSLGLVGPGRTQRRNSNARVRNTGLEPQAPGTEHPQRHANARFGLHVATACAVVVPFMGARRSSEVAVGRRGGVRIAPGCTSSEAPFAETDPRVRSEEHTSELQSPCNLVCRLLLEKKKKKKSHLTALIISRNKMRRKRSCVRDVGVYYEHDIGRG